MISHTEYEPLSTHWLLIFDLGRVLVLHFKSRSVIFVFDLFLFVLLLACSQVDNGRVTRLPSFVRFPGLRACRFFFQLKISCELWWVGGCSQLHHCSRNLLLAKVPLLTALDHHLYNLLHMQGDPLPLSLLLSSSSSLSSSSTSSTTFAEFVS